MPHISFDRRLARRVRWLAPALAPLALGCTDLLGAHDCTAEVRAGIVLRVVDARTNRAPAITPVVTVTAQDYVETPPVVPPFDDAQVFYAAYERAGRYTLTINAPGYQPWAQTGVQVQSGTCHVTTVTVNAALIPTP